MFQVSLAHIIDIYQSPVTLGLILEIIFILFLALSLSKFPNNRFSILFEIIYTKMSAFYLEILGTKGEKWVLTYILSLFCIILFSNLLGVSIELLSPIFGLDTQGDFFLEKYATAPTSDINFNLAMAIVSICVLLLALKESKGIWHLLYEYFPIFGKGYITLGETHKGKWYYYPVFIFAKVLDSIFSLLIGILDLVGLGAKVISLSFRLFGNIASGTILLAIVVGALTLFTKQMIGFSFPILLPLLVYLLGILVAVVQAFVFTLLLSVSIKVAKLTS